LGVGDNGGVDRPENFGIDVGVEQRLIHPAGALTSVSRGYA
jgi:hypothetical protein